MANLELNSEEYNEWLQMDITRDVIRQLKNQLRELPGEIVDKAENWGHFLQLKGRKEQLSDTIVFLENLKNQKE